MAALVVQIGSGFAMVALVVLVSMADHPIGAWLRGDREEEES